MEREEVSRMPNLPEDVVELILGMVPFPNIFKARALSKLWLARLSHASSQDDDQVTSSLAISFQRWMGEYWTAKWIFCPVLFHKDKLVAYDPRTHMWNWFPFLPSLPENSVKCKIQLLAGALLFTVPWPDQGDLLVSNVLTRTSRMLPPRPLVLEKSSFSHLTITPVIHKETYIVIALYQSKLGLPFALIYNSKVDAWRIKEVELPEGFNNHGAGEYLDGVVYWLVGPKKDTRGLLLFKVAEETFLFLKMPPTYASSILKVCAGRLLLAFFYRHERRLVGTVKTVDIESRNWLEMTRGPPKAACDCRLGTLHNAIDPDCIFLLVAKRGQDVLLVYSVQNGDWNSIPGFPQENISRGFLVSFQPGLNPFMRP